MISLILKMNFNSSSLQPLRRLQKICVAIPASLISDTPHLREKTFKVGLVGRALAIFRVDEVAIYPDQPKIDQSRDLNFIATILSYMETPQYLRKRLFGIMPELRYAGILPPLRTPHHPTQSSMRNLRVGEFREGVVVSEARDGVLADIGVERPILVLGARVPAGKRITVKVTSTGEEPKAILSSRDEIPIYWGYNVRVSNFPLGKMIREEAFDLVIATSRRGEQIMRVKDAILERWKRSRRVLIAFGSPTQGLYEIVRQEGIELDDLADFVINTIPKQAAETVRTEEALYATLAIFNIMTED
jgi:predicted SPOUT superfamily RNA methylase MTH1